MSNLRFTIYAVALFAAGFVGLSWASKGFPVTGVRTAMKPDATVAANDSVKPAQRDEREKIKDSRGDNDPGRQQLRLTAIQAAGAYRASPCDLAVKAAFIVATSTYVQAMTAKKDDKKAFTTPLDMRAREAIEAAFETGGVSKDEFPAGAQLWVAAVTKPQGDAAPPCIAGRRADNLLR
jgi:hypothetical protein